MSPDLIVLAIFGLAWLVLCLFGHGYPNTVDTLAYWLHRHADKVRTMHARRAAEMQQKWVRELERGDA